MAINNTHPGTADVPEAAATEGPTLHHFRGEENYRAMVRTVADSSETDQEDDNDTAERVTRRYRHLTDSDPAQDMVFAEIDDEAID